MRASSKALRSRTAGPVAWAIAGMFLLVFQGTALAGVGSEQLDRFLQHRIESGSGSEWTSIIVQSSDSATLGGLTALGATIVQALPRLKAFAVRVPTSKLLAIAELPGVSRISEDVAVFKADQYTNSASGADFVFDQLGLTGSQIGVAVVDSGIRTHRDVKGQPSRSRIVADVS